MSSEDTPLSPSATLLFISAPSVPHPSPLSSMSGSSQLCRAELRLQFEEMPSFDEGQKMCVRTQHPEGSGN